MDDLITLAAILTLCAVVWLVREVRFSHRLRSDWNDAQPEMVRWCRLSDRAELCHPLTRADGSWVTRGDLRG